MMCFLKPSCSFVVDGLTGGKERPCRAAAIHRYMCWTVNRETTGGEDPFSSVKGKGRAPLLLAAWVFQTPESSAWLSVYVLCVSRACFVCASCVFVCCLCPRGRTSKKRKNHNHLLCSELSAVLGSTPRLSLFGRMSGSFSLLWLRPFPSCCTSKHYSPP